MICDTIGHPVTSTRSTEAWDATPMPFTPLSVHNSARTLTPECMKFSSVYTGRTGKHY